MPINVLLFMCLDVNTCLENSCSCFILNISDRFIDHASLVSISDFLEISIKQTINIFNFTNNNNSDVSFSRIELFTFQIASVTIQIHENWVPWHWHYREQCQSTYICIIKAYFLQAFILIYSVSRHAKNRLLHFYLPWYNLLIYEWQITLKVMCYM